MRKIRNDELADRRGKAVDAKAALLRTYRAAKEAAEPGREAKQAERIAFAQARETRRTKRQQVKLAEQARQEAEIARHDAMVVAAAKAEADERELAAKNRIARVLQDEAVRKAERDRRYANRKARRA